MVLVSVGHGALDREALVALLRGAGVETLVDIRRYPNSRHNPDVNQGAITAWAHDADSRCQPLAGFVAAFGRSVAHHEGPRGEVCRAGAVDSSQAAVGVVARRAGL